VLGLIGDIVATLVATSETVITNTPRQNERSQSQDDKVMKYEPGSL
jgi:hypothetical protein